MESARRSGVAAEWSGRFGEPQGPEVDMSRPITRGPQSRTAPVDFSEVARERPIASLERSESRAAGPTGRGSRDFQISYLMPCLFWSLSEPRN
jgi:hypothetical protein